MRFKVPQLDDTEDTILFGLSFVKMIYIGGALSFVFFLAFLGGGVFVAILFGGPVMVLALLLSFYKFNNQPFSTLLQAMIRFVLGKKRYVWKQDGSKDKEKTKIIVKNEAGEDRARRKNEDDSDKIKKIKTSLFFNEFEDDDKAPII